MHPSTTPLKTLVNLTNFCLFPEFLFSRGRKRVHWKWVKKNWPEIHQFHGAFSCLENTEEKKSRKGCILSK